MEQNAIPVYSPPSNYSDDDDIRLRLFDEDTPIVLPVDVTPHSPAPYLPIPNFNTIRTSTSGVEGSDGRAAEYGEYVEQDWASRDCLPENKPQYSVPGLIGKSIIYLEKI